MSSILPSLFRRILRIISVLVIFVQTARDGGRQYDADACILLYYIRHPAKGLFVTRTRSLVTSRHVCFLSAHDRKCCQNDYCKNMQKSVLSRLNRLRSARRWQWHVDTFLILRFHLLVIFTQYNYGFSDRNRRWYWPRKIL